MSNGGTRKLIELDASFMHVEYGGVKYEALVFKCPKDECGHYCLIPFHDGPCIKVARDDGIMTPIWHKVSGSIVEDLSLSPSYQIVGGCALHGFVTGGSWVGC